MITKKRVSFVVMMFMMICFVLPLNMEKAYAEEGENPSISVGTGNIEKGNKVYMGVRYVEKKPVPISWLVLGASNSSDLKNMMDQKVNPENARLLITEKTQGGVQFDPNGQSNTWQGSNIQNWCTDTFLNDSDWNGSRYQNHFTESEKSTMLSTSKTDDEYNEWATSELKNEKLFLLSAEEVSDEHGYFNGYESRIAYKHDKDETSDWWLRSPHSIISKTAARVILDGDVDDRNVEFTFGARPAFNFDLTSVLFTSAAEGGKTSGTAGANALRAVSGTGTKEWKLTLKDESRSSFEARAAEGAVLAMSEGYTSWTITVTYSGAKTGNNEYVSAILCDSKGKALYYGNIAKGSAASSGSGQVVAIPAGLPLGDYTLYVFNEQINGDRRTDYASSFSTIELHVKPHFHVDFYYGIDGPPIVTPPDSSEEINYGQIVTPPEPKREGYTLLGWRDVHSSGDELFDFSQGIVSDCELAAVWMKNEPPAGNYPVSIRDAKIVLSETSFTYNGKVQRPAIKTINGETVAEGKDYTIEWSDASSKDTGTYTVTITGKGSYEGTTTATYTISKAANPLAVKGKKARVKYKKLVKRAQKLNVGKTMTFIRKGKGRMKYKLTAAKKGKKSFLKYFRINARTGRMAIKKGLKRGTYKVVVKMKAAGTGNYKASAVKKVKILFKVK